MNLFLPFGYTGSNIKLVPDMVKMKRGQLFTTSSERVAQIAGHGKTLEEAGRNAYKGTQYIDFEDMYAKFGAI